MQASTPRAGEASIRPVDLRCEYRVNPLGLQEKQPRLSWTLEAIDSAARGQRQTAYRIIVSSSLQKLEQGTGDLWDTGKVDSDQTAQIEYSGSELKSGTECWWKVQVWDEQGRPSAWSEPARWSMGPLSEEEWKASWIGYDAPPRKTKKDPLNLWGCQWIWFPEGNPREDAIPGTCYLRRVVEVPSDRAVRQARVVITADDQFVLYVNGAKVAESAKEQDSWKTPAMVDLSGAIKPGRNIIAVEARNLEGGPAGVAGKLVLELDDGQIVVATNREWKVGKKAESGWIDLNFDDSCWPQAREVAPTGEGPWGYVEPSGLELYPLPMMRKSFDVGGKVKRAFLHVSALGTCQVRINGAEVADDVFIPGRSDYRKRAYYRTYDVTNLLKQGKNALGAILSDDWYAGYCGGWMRRAYYGGEPRLLVQLEIEKEDGSVQLVVTDDSWKATYGPIREADFYMGETHDARLEIPGWDEPDFDDGDWDPVEVEKDRSLELTWHPGPPVRRIMELQPVAKDEVEPGVYVFDLGQNMVGRARIRIRGAKAGQKVVMRFAEIVRANGKIYTPNLRGARNTDTYICKGLDEEVWEPSFTFRGFRYVEVTGYPGEPDLDDVTGVVLHSDFPITGDFTSSNDLLNRLYQNIVWGLRGNYCLLYTSPSPRD